jgi:hypothetical protein
VLKIDYDNIVTDKNMRRVLKYRIPTGKVWYDRKGKTMVRKFGSETAATLPVKAPRVAPGPKRSVKPKTDASKSKKVGKPTTIPRVMAMPRSDRIPAVLAKVTEPKSRKIGASGKETPTASASTAPLEPTKLAKEPTEASKKRALIASPGDRPTGITPAPGSNVIEIEDEPEELVKGVPLNRSEAKHKGK